MTKVGPQMSTGPQHKLARAQGVEEGLTMALSILEDLAETMLERERAADPRKKSNYPRRTRIKAYQVAARRIGTQLKRQHRLLERMETADDQQHDDERLRAAVANLAL